MCQLTTRFLSDAAQNDGGGGQWSKQNQVAADAGLKTQVTVWHLPLRPGRRRWLARSRKYEVRTCLAAGVIAAACRLLLTHPTHTLPGLDRGVSLRLTGVRSWVVVANPDPAWHVGACWPSAPLPLVPPRGAVVSTCTHICVAGSIVASKLRQALELIGRRGWSRRSTSRGTGPARRAGG